MPPHDERENVLLPPPADLDDLHAIWEYAHAGRDSSFDGYNHALTFLGREAASIANERIDEYQHTGTWRGTFEELRVCLFFEARRWRHFGYDPEGSDAEAIRALVGALTERSPTL